MSKKLRFLLVLAFLGLAGYLIYPTITWYFFTPKTMQDLANGTRESIRTYAQQQAIDDRDELIALFAVEANLEQPLPGKFDYLIPVAKKNYKILKERRPSEWTLGAVLHGFEDGNDLYNAIEIHYKDEILT
jgi:preprotein translocase subunit SecD